MPELTTGGLLMSNSYCNSVNDHIAPWNLIAELSGDVNRPLNCLLDVLLSFPVGISLADTSPHSTLCQHLHNGGTIIH